MNDDENGHYMQYKPWNMLLKQLENSRKFCKSPFGKQNEAEEIEKTRRNYGC